MENYFEETREQNQVILMGLCEDAAKEVSDEVGNVLRSYDIFKSAKNNTYSLMKYKKPVLTEAAQFLRIDTDNMNKDVMVSSIIDKIAALFLEPCRKCKSYYSVKRCDVPKFTCFFCGQGCHDTCYSQQNDELNSAHGMFYACISCEQSRGTKRKLYSGYPPLTETEKVQDDAPDAPKKKAMCRFFKKGSCKHGSDGKTNGECKFDHPNVCEKYTNYGKFSRYGCNDQECDKVHPKICYKGVNTGACYDKYCKYFHGSCIKRKRDKPLENPQRLHRNPNSQHDNPMPPRPSPDAFDAPSTNIFLEALISMKADLRDWMTGVEARLANSDPTPTQGYQRVVPLQVQGQGMPANFPIQPPFPAPWQQSQQSNMV